MQKYSVSLTDDAQNDLAELVAFYAELVDDESAERFLDEALDTLSSLEKLPHGNPVFKDDSEVRKIQMKNHRVAIIYLIDDGRYEVIAVRAYHQMQNPIQYQESVRNRLQQLRG